MPRDFRQDVNGYSVAIRHFEKEYKRALANTTRSKEVYQGSLNRIEWLLEVYRREQRELMVKARQAAGASAPSSGRERGKKKASAGQAA